MNVRHRHRFNESHRSSIESFVMKTIRIKKTFGQTFQSILFSRWIDLIDSAKTNFAYSCSDNLTKNRVVNHVKISIPKRL